MPEFPASAPPHKTVYPFARLPCSPAASPFLKAVAVGNKEPARPPLPRLRDPGARPAVEGERELGHESKFAAVRADFGSAGAGGEASASFLAARGTRGSGASALVRLHPG